MRYDLGVTFVSDVSSLCICPEIVVSGERYVALRSMGFRLVKLDGFILLAGRFGGRYWRWVLVGNLNESPLFLD